MDKKALTVFTQSLWDEPSAIELRFFDHPDPENPNLLGRTSNLSNTSAKIEIFPIDPAESDKHTYWTTVLHELAHVAVFLRNPDSFEDVHGATFRSEYRRLLHRAVALYRQEPLWDVLVEAVDEIGDLRAQFPAKEPPCRFWFHEIRRPWYTKLWRWLRKTVISH